MMVIIQSILTPMMIEHEKIKVIILRVIKYGILHKMKWVDNDQIIRQIT